MVREETLQIIDEIPEVGSVVEWLQKALAAHAKAVVFAFLFGSYARGEADRWSDVDVGIYVAEGTGDEERTRIRFALTDALSPLEVQVGFLDSEGMSPDIFLSAVRGIPVVMNDEDAFFEQLLKHIHRKEEMRLHGLAEEDQYH